MDHNDTVDNEEFELDLSVLSNEELVEFEALLVSEYTAKRSTEELGQEDVQELREIANVISAVRAEATFRMEQESIDEIVGDASEFNAFSDFLKKKKAKKMAAAEMPEDEMVEDEEEEEMGAEAPEAPAADIKGKNVNIVISPKGLDGDAPAATGRGTGNIVASADVRGFRAGQELSDLKEVAAAFMAKRPDVRGTDRGHDGARFLVASVNHAYDADRTLTMDLDANMQKINAVASPEAIIASGGLCAPLTPLYELRVFGDANRPVRDAIPAFRAERGGIRFMPPPVIGDLSGSVRITTAAQDAAGYGSGEGETAPKPSIHVTCPSEQTVKVDAYSRILTFGNMSARTYPEQVEAWLKLGMAEFARYTEQSLLDQLDTGSIAVTASQQYGTTWSLLKQVAVTVASFKHRNRVSSGVQMRALMPWWVKEIIRTDIAAQATGDGLNRYAVSDAQIADWFSTRGVTPTFYQDDSSAVAPSWSAPVAGGIQEWPTEVQWFLYPEGTWLFLDGGSLDLGLVRDSTLNSVNDYQVFYEEFFGLAKVGLDESLVITSTICPNGDTAGPIDNIITC
jgi:hypothetical protein